MWESLRRLGLDVVAVLAILGVGCTGPRQEHGFAGENYKGVVRIACVGDSITYGSGIENREVNHYPVALQRLLGPRYEAENFGVSGATLLKKGDKPYWEQLELKEVAEFGPRLVIIKLGTNDSKPENWKHKVRFDKDLREMIDHFRRLETRPYVWVCLPAPVHEDRWGIRSRVLQEEIRPIIQKVAAEKDVKVVDLYEPLRDRPDYFHDGIHPNAAGAAKIAQVLHREIKQHR